MYISVSLATSGPRRSPGVRPRTSATEYRRRTASSMSVPSARGGALASIVARYRLTRPASYNHAMVGASTSRAGRGAYSSSDRAFRSLTNQYRVA
jgi:hypothetical protein